MPITLPLPPDQKLTRSEGHTYVKTPSGPIPLDQWRITQWLHTLDTFDIRCIARKVCQPLPLPIALEGYGEEDNREGLIMYLRCVAYSWYDIGLTVARIESEEFKIPRR
jgi:hypothetical protein